MKAYNWYATLVKPSWAPPAWIFGPVWSILYIIIAVSFGYTVFLFLTRRVSFAVLLPFLLNLVFNFAFTPIQFGLRNNYLAAADILIVLATLIWAMKMIYRYAHRLAYVQIPYLVWITFATVLQLTIMILNV